MLKKGLRQNNYAFPLLFQTQLEILGRVLLMYTCVIWSLVLHRFPHNS